MDSSALTLDRSTSCIRGVWLVFISCFVEIPDSIADSVDPDQMLHFMVSDLDLHCLPVSLLWDARLKWVKIKFIQQTEKAPAQAELGFRCSRIPVHA